MLDAPSATPPKARRPPVRVGLNPRASARLPAAYGNPPASRQGTRFLHAGILVAHCAHSVHPASRSMLMRGIPVQALGSLLLLLCLAGPARAQVFTPAFSSPRLINDVGLYLSDGPGDVAVEAILRRGLIGLRVGYVDLPDGALSLGAEVRNPIPVSGAPVALSFASGVQALVASETSIGLQVGLIGGYTALQPGMAITPYLYPRVGALNEVGDDTIRARALADVGVDLEFWNGMVFRFGVALGDLGSRWGFGAALRY
jgi:hypothetical protein